MEISVAMAFNENTPVGLIKDAVQMVEAKGAYGIWVPEHVLFYPEYTSVYPYADNGRIPGNPEGLLDPFTALTYIAAHTSKVRLGTGILFGSAAPTGLYRENGRRPRLPLGWSS